MTVDAPEAPRGSGPEPSAMPSLLTRIQEACDLWNRPDLTARLQAASARLERPSPVVAVVGAYKQGKSSLVNALAGSPVCPVDDDLATTAITVVYGATTPLARIRRAVEGRTEVEPVPFDQLPRFVSEAGSEPSIDLVEVGIPSPLLADGVTLVDTPGVGGLLDRHTSLTLRFLALADATLFVTDASQEMTAPEVSILERIREVCPTLLVALTKADLYLERDRILDLDRRHLASRGIETEPIPVSAALRMAALERADPDLDAESGIPGLVDALKTEVLDGARARAAARATAEARWVLNRLLDPIESEMAALDDPEAAAAAVERLQSAGMRLRTLQEAGSRWVTVLNDGFTDLRSQVDYRIRADVRALLTRTDERLAGVDPAADWEALATEVQQGAAAMAEAAVTSVLSGAGQIAESIAALLVDEEGEALSLTGQATPDATAIWGSAERGLTATAPHGMLDVLASGLTALRGASSGMILLGMIGNLAGLALATPVSLGVAAFFGAKQVLDSRKAAVKQRRQEARAVIRGYLDEVNLEVGTRVRQLAQDAQRSIRDHYSARLQELSRSATAAIEAAQQAAAQDQASRQERAARLREWSHRLHRLLEELDREGDAP